jgi:hypothetical protein
VVSFTPRPLYLRYRSVEKRPTRCPFQESIPGRLVPSLVTIMTELPPLSIIIVVVVVIIITVVTIIIIIIVIIIIIIIIIFGMNLPYRLSTASANVKFVRHNLKVCHLLSFRQLIMRTPCY